MSCNEETEKVVQLPVISITGIHLDQKGDGGMEENLLVEVIKDQTCRALWEVKNVIDCVPEDLWNKAWKGNVIM